MSNTNTIIFRGYPRPSRRQARRMSRIPLKNRWHPAKDQRQKVITMARISSATKHVNRLNSLPQESQNDGKEDIERLVSLNESEELNDSLELKRDTRRENPSTDLSPSASLSKNLSAQSEAQPQSDKQKRAAHLKEILAGSFNDAMYAAHQQHLADIANRGADDEFSTPLFKFIWTIRGHRDLTKYLTDPAKAFKVVTDHLIGWTSYSKQHQQKATYGITGDAWQDWFNIPTDDARLEFADLWEKSRFRAGESPLESAVKAARERRLSPSDETAKKREMVINPKSEKDYSFFLSVCGHLQTAVGDGEIMLPVEALGKLLGLSPMSISRLVRMLIEDGYLERKSGQKKGRAARYRFAAGRWKCLTEKAEKLGVELSE